MASFQEEQLAQLDAMDFGFHVREELLKELAQHQGETEPAPEVILQGVDFTGLALNVLRADIFDQSLAAIDHEFDEQPVVQARLLQSFARSAERVGLMDLAVEVQRRTCDIRDQNLGPDHPDSISARNNLGLLLLYQGQYDEAQPILTQALADSRRTKGDQHPDTLSVLDNIGLLMHELGRFGEAESYLQEALAGYKAHFPADAPETLAAMNNIASVYEGRGEFAKSEPFLREAYEGNKRVLGPDDAKTLSSANNVAINLKRQGKLAEAEPFYREAYEGRRRTLGDDHPRTIRALNNMGGLYRALEEYEKCEETYRVSLEQYRRINGNHHPDTVIGINNYGAVLRDLGRFEEAERYGAEAVQLGSETFPPGHWIVAAFMLQHSETLLAMGRLDEALAEAEASRSVMMNSLGESHPNTQGAASLVNRIEEALQETHPVVDP